MSLVQYAMRVMLVNQFKKLADCFRLAFVSSFARGDKLPLGDNEWAAFMVVFSRFSAAVKDVAAAFIALSGNDWLHL